MNTWKIILATLVIFGTGVITGGLLVSYAVHVNPVARVMKPIPAPQQANTPWQQRNKELLRRMERDLDLTPQQLQRIEKHIAESSDRTKNLWKPIAPMMNKEMQRLHRDIRDELNPEQVKKYDELSKPRGGLQNRRLLTNQPAAVPTNSVPANAVPAN